MYSKDQRQQMIAIARQSIEHGLTTGQPIAPNHNDFDTSLLTSHSCFVTLKLSDRLRGCIGSLETDEALIDNIANNAFKAAFHDPRFPAITEKERVLLNISLSILGTAEEVNCDSQQALIDQLQPGIDGLILVQGNHKATFLPSVWEQLPDPEDFLRQLKLKAGLSGDYWSGQLKFQKYTVESIS